ncbi:MAG: 4-alpha-glucanotransferase [Proteobacteria bacterium]|nr:4-alpha-glucanotransferase [Pseudomonadota bacterium]
MTDDAVRTLARRAGIAVDWTDAAGGAQQVSIPSLTAILAALGLPCATPGDLADSKRRMAERQARCPLLTATVGAQTPLPGPELPGAAEIVLEDGTVAPVKLRAIDGGVAVPAIRIPGYHRLRYGDRETGLAVAPRRCVTVDDIAPDARPWGVMAQVYSLRRDGDGGIGDSGAVAELAEAAARRGADAVTLSPTHALFPARPERYGPYSPSSRLFLNPLLADPSAVFGKDAVGKVPEGGAGLIDWPDASRAKYALFRRLYDRFSDPGLVADFERFVATGGERLAAHARFEAAQEGAPGDERFSLFLQWVADRAFASAQSRARAAGMRIGLITDLAVGIDRDGSEAATRRQDLLSGLKIGAPPDAFNLAGQDWGLTTFSPDGLVAGGFEPFIATLRAALRHAGGVRIDHAMGLMRLWLIPDGAGAADGAYLSYPLDDLLRLLALESHRHKAIVIGEDLGTVPPEFRRRCKRAGIAGMDVLWFQRDGERFLPPAKWRSDAVAMTTTHDLPTVAGWWRSEESGRAPLWRAFSDAEVTSDAQPAPDAPSTAVDAAVAFVATASSSLALIPIEDIVGTSEQPNVPGTLDQHPNWRHRFDLSAEELLADPAAEHRLRSMRERRA